jgi:large conductance mechanosensitive channel
MLKEFKNFIMTGNVIDLAVGVILAGLIGAVTGSFVADIAMPFLGFLTSSPDLSKLSLVLSEEVKDAAGVVTKPANILGYGKLITAIVNLIITGFVLFMIVKAYNKVNPKAPDAPAGPSEVDLLTEIRDALKK